MRLTLSYLMKGIKIYMKSNSFITSRPQKNDSVEYSTAVTL